MQTRIILDKMFLDLVEKFWISIKCDCICVWYTTYQIQNETNIRKEANVEQQIKFD